MAFKKSLFLFLICTISALVSLAQQSEKYEKSYRKFNEFLRKGDVFEANDEYQRIRKKFEPKNANAEDTLKLIYSEALLFQLKGDNNFAIDLTDSYISKAKTKLIPIMSVL